MPGAYVQLNTQTQSRGQNTGPLEPARTAWDSTGLDPQSEHQSFSTNTVGLYNYSTFQP